MFYLAGDFPFTQVLEAHVDEIRAEAEGIRPLMADWYETKLHEKCWQVYGLYDFPRESCWLTMRHVAPSPQR